ncbi:MAG: RagB/SusD family nutrient uptake outer membrane protein [Chitinophagaceae bacterium]|nr:RagB/SusD family nutrient uptake outer membrane protein [Chitinophagaceae bacterium]MBK8952276.1 RagB/SusD family nutrient uptake outer membrane protein [Chitinophagaceae bacterium]
MRKKIFNLLFILAVPAMGMMFGSCKKFLDRKPLQASLEDLNQGGVEGLTFGLYGAFLDRNGAYHGFSSIPWFGLNSFRGDDAMKGSSASDGADWGLIYDNFQYQKSHWSSSIYWDHHYNLINKTNTVIQTADSLQLTDPASLINVAEAKFFRALSYFDLVRVFGEVPKIDFRVYVPNDMKKAKATVAQIWALIDADLSAGITNLPEDWINAAGNNKYPGRLTKYSAMAFAAKAKLYRQDWAGALALCQQIISSTKYELLTNYKSNFLVEGENGKESLFEIQANVGPNGVPDNGYEYGVEQGVRGSGTWDLGWGWNTPEPGQEASYESGDARRSATILYSGQDDGYGKTVPAYPAVLPRAYWNKKVYPEPSMQTLTGRRQNSWLNHVLLRYADVVLMAAEAANELGGATNQTNATTWVNLIRSRAGLGSISFTSQAQMRVAIKQERRSEFAMEGERFFDLVRWGDAESILGTSGYTPCHKYYPLPQSAIDFAGGILVQNPCW